MLMATSEPSPTEAVSIESQGSFIFLLLNFVIDLSGFAIEMAKGPPMAEGVENGLPRPPTARYAPQIGLLLQ
jgi:hypothetical protein